MIDNQDSVISQKLDLLKFLEKDKSKKYKYAVRVSNKKTNRHARSLDKRSCRSLAEDYKLNFSKIDDGISFASEILNKTSTRENTIDKKSRSLFDENAAKRLNLKDSVKKELFAASSDYSGKQVSLQNKPSWGLYSISRLDENTIDRLPYVKYGANKVNQTAVRRFYNLSSGDVTLKHKNPK